MASVTRSSRRSASPHPGRPRPRPGRAGRAARAGVRKQRSVRGATGRRRHASGLARSRKRDPDRARRPAVRRSRQLGHRWRDRGAPCNRRARDDRRLVGASQGVPRPALRLGLLRRLAELQRPLVLDEGVRRPGEGPRVLPPQDARGLAEGFRAACPGRSRRPAPGRDPAAGPGPPSRGSRRQRPSSASRSPAPGGPS